VRNRSWWPVSVIVGFCFRRLLLHDWHRQAHHLAQLGVLSVSGFCASCLPLTESYYVPSAEGAQVVSTTCAGGPPYAASSFGDGVHMLVSIQSAFLWIQIIADHPDATIAFDPTLIGVEADGMALILKSIQYTIGPSASAPIKEVVGPIQITDGYLTIKVPLGLRDSSEVITHVPSVNVNGRVTIPSKYSFKFEKRTHFTKITLNC
jgi:hypothetical protein